LIFTLIYAVTQAVFWHGVGCFFCIILLQVRHM